MKHLGIITSAVVGAIALLGLVRLLTLHHTLKEAMQFRSILLAACGPLITRPLDLLKSAVRTILLVRV